jgi:hypothetical protein
LKPAAHGVLHVAATATGRSNKLVGQTGEYLLHVPGLRDVRSSRRSTLGWFRTVPSGLARIRCCPRQNNGIGAGRRCVRVGVVKTRRSSIILGWPGVFLLTQHELCPEGASFFQPRATPWEQCSARTFVGPTAQAFFDGTVGPLGRTKGRILIAAFPGRCPGLGEPRAFGPVGHLLPLRLRGLAALRSDMRDPGLYAKPPSREDAKGKTWSPVAQ